MSGGFYALSASKTIFSDDNYLVNETREKPTTGARCPTHELDMPKPLFT